MSMYVCVCVCITVTSFSLFSKRVYAESALFSVAAARPSLLLALVSFFRALCPKTFRLD